MCPHEDNRSADEDMSRRRRRRKRRAVGGGDKLGSQSSQISRSSNSDERRTNCGQLNEPAPVKLQRAMSNNIAASLVYCLLLLVIGPLLCLQLTKTSSGLVHCQEAKRRNLFGGEQTTNSGLDETKGPVDLLDRNRRMAPSMAAYLMPANELRVSGSKSEPPSRPSQDWSKQRPHFGDIQREVSVELGKTAYLTCKVYDLGDKTVSWLRPRENEILTSGRFTYVGDDRFASYNEHGNHDWVLEIKDVGLNDSTSYECQVSTDPKMSTIINLHVKAAKAKIKQGEQYYAPVGTNIEFTCEISLRAGAVGAAGPPSLGQQTYWYYNGNLLNYAPRSHSADKNFSIEWDPMTQTSRFKLYNVQLTDAGNYSCKPTSAEPTSIRLHVKRANQRGPKDRTQSGYHSANTKEAQRTRGQHYGTNGQEDNGAGIESVGSWAAPRLLPPLPTSSSLLLLVVLQLAFLSLLADNNRL